MTGLAVVSAIAVAKSETVTTVETTMTIRSETMTVRSDAMTVRGDAVTQTIAAGVTTVGETSAVAKTETISAGIASVAVSVTTEVLGGSDGHQGEQSESDKGLHCAG